MGNAIWGGQREDLPPGDYLAQITDVELGERDDFKDPDKKTDAFVWKIAYQKPDGYWEYTTYRSGRVISPLQGRGGRPKPMISGLIHLIAACGFPVPQTPEAVAAWDERSLIGRQFIWRFEADPAGGTSRRFLPMAPAVAQPQVLTPAPAPPRSPVPPTSPPPPGPTPDQVYAQAPTQTPYAAATVASPTPQVAASPSPVAAQMAQMAPVVAADDPFAHE